MRHFKCAAIRYKTDEDIWTERRGRRHHEIIKAIHDAGETEQYKKSHIDGFIIGEDWTAEFVDRETATEIAKEMGIKMRGCVLTSDDLW